LFAADVYCSGTCQGRKLAGQKMRKLWFLAPACVLLFSLQVLAAHRADSRSTKPKDDAVTVELFDAIKSGDIEVRVIAKDAAAGNVLIKNVTAKRLAIRLPEAFAAVPVAAQFGAGGGPFGGGAPFGGGGNLFGGGFPGGGGVGLNNGLMGQGGANQALGAGFQPGQNGLNGGNFGRNGGGPGLGINNAFPGGLFKVEPEKVGKLKMTSVCLEYGKPDPNPHKEYELRPLDTVVRDPATMEAIRMLATGEIDQKDAQAAAWHLCNGLSWEELEKKIGRKHLTGQIDLFFTADHLARGKEIVKEAQKRAAAKEKDDDRSTSLAQQ
jgi:hypothetical protein